MPIVIPSRVAERAANRYFTVGFCWVSTYSKNRSGYAQIGWQNGPQRQLTLAHRAAWVHTNGQIPDELTIDHICRTHGCVRPSHLRLLTNLANATDNGSADRRTSMPCGRFCCCGAEKVKTTDGLPYCLSCGSDRRRRHRERTRASRRPNL